MYSSRSVRFIAEVSSNHSRDLERCFAFIDRAAEIGCSAVKFQLFKIDELFAPEALAAHEHLRKRTAWELPVEFLPPIAERCWKNRILFGCTPFYLRGVDELTPYIDFFKIASYELLWNALLEACARTGKPVMLSTGMASLDEVLAAVETLKGTGCRDLTLFHCVSGYPAPFSDCNLAAIETLRQETRQLAAGMNISFGWSDHSVNEGVIQRAIHRWGATTVEFHLDLDGRGEEFHTGHCWLPDRIAPVISLCAAGFEADGRGEKAPVPVEMPDRSWRADPTDGLRPLKSIREKLGK